MSSAAVVIGILRVNKQFCICINWHKYLLLFFNNPYFECYYVDCLSNLFFIYDIDNIYICIDIGIFYSSLDIIN